MTDVVVFGFGCLVASMCAAAIGVLVQAARQDGAKNESRPSPVTPRSQPVRRAVDRATI